MWERRWAATASTHFPFRRSQGHRSSAARRSEARNADRLGLVRDYRQASVPGDQLDRGQPGSQLGLGHHSGHRRHQSAPVPAAALEHEIVEEDAAATAADRRDQRQVQESFPARSEEDRAEPGSDGSVQAGGRESRGRLSADAVADAVFLRVLPRAERLHRNARRKLAVGARSFAAGNAGDSRAAGAADCHAVSVAEDDAAARRRSVAAEDDDVHAAGARLYVLLRARPGWCYTG